MTDVRAAAPEEFSDDGRRYPGVRSFKETDATRFFGRQRVAQELLLRVRSVRLLLQFAPSGVGKSSVLQAGLFPLLRPHGLLPLMVRLNLADETLSAAVRRSLVQAAAEQRLVDPVIPADAPDTATLLAGTQLWTDELSLLTPVLVFDQFEEVFTLRDEAFRRGFAQDIGALVGMRVQAQAAQATAAKVIISLREEFLGRLDAFTADIPELFRERLRLAPLSRDEAALCVTAPAALPGDGWVSPRFGFSAACLDTLLDFVGGSAASRGAIEPLTLQLVCRHGEALVIARSRQAAAAPLPQLELADFGGLDGLTKLVSEHYRREIGKLPTAAARRGARDLFEQALLDPAGKRLMLEEGEIERKHGVTRPLLEALVDSHLLRCEPRNDSLFYEISHDRLAEAIARQRRVRLPRWVWQSLGGAGVLVVLAVIAIVVVRREKERTDLALHDVSRAYGLMLGNTLVPRLMEAGAADALDNVLGSLVDRQPEPGVSPLVLVMRHLGDLAFDRSTLAEARKQFQDALDELGIPSAAEPAARRPAQAERARLLGRLANVEADAGELVRARTHFDAAAALWAQVLASGPQLDERMDAAEMDLALATLASRQGEPEVAEGHAARALGRLAEAWLGAQADPANGQRNMAFEQGRALQLMADAVVVRATVWNDDVKPYAAAAALAREAMRLRPQSTPAMRELATANAMLGGAQAAAAGAMLPQPLVDALQQMGVLMRFDPDHLRLRREEAAVRLKVAQRLADCIPGPQCDGRTAALRQAQSGAIEATGDLRWLAAMDTDNKALRADIGWALAEQARVREALHDDAGAVTLLDAALAEYRQARGSDPDLDSLSSVADVLMRRATVQARRGQTQAAQDSMALALKELDAAPKAGNGVRLARATVLEGHATLLRQLKRSAQADAAQAEREGLLKDLIASSARQRERAGEDDTHAVEALNKAAPLAAEPALVLQREAVRHSLLAIAADPASDDHWDTLRIAFAAVAQSLQTRAASAAEAASAAGAATSAASAAAGPADASIPSNTADRADRADPLTASPAAALGAALAAASMAHVLSDTTGTAERHDRLYEARRDLALYHRDHDSGGLALALARDGVFQSRDLAPGTAVSARQLAQLRDAYYGIGLMRFETASGGWEEPMRLALEHGAALARLRPSDAGHRLWLGKVHADLGAKLRDKKRPDDAAAEHRLAASNCRSALSLATGQADVRKEAQDCIGSVPAELR